jgi:membrane-bound lytic murein transglycosylase A
MSSNAELTPLSFAQIDGWIGHDFSPALAAFRSSCAEIMQDGRAFGREVRFGGSRGDWLTVCRGASEAGIEARKFFENRFQPLLVGDPDRASGLFTGYYEPEAPGSRHRTAHYKVPLYAKPADLVTFDVAEQRQTGLRYGRRPGGRPEAYFTRRDIEEEGALAGRNLEIAWLASWADAFFMQIQGSGRVKLADGQVMRLAYAAKNGLPFTAIGGILAQRGELPAGAVSMQSIREWLAANPRRSRKLMWENRSFVFFREVELGTAFGPPGAQMVNLTPMRSLAVDRSFWAFGTPLWIETTVPGRPESSRPEPFRQLMVAQDTGSAIKGRVRGDIFFGSGDEAAWKAGHLKSPGRMIALLPKPLAQRLLRHFAVK